MKFTLRDKIRFYDRDIMDSETLMSIIRATSQNMSINDVCTMGYVAPIRPGKSYLNKLNGRVINTSVIGAVYTNDTEYMIGGMRIYNMYGFTTQLAEVTDVYNVKYSREKYIDNQRFVFRKIQKQFLYGFDKVEIQGYEVNVMSPERAFIEYVRERMLQPEKDFFEMYVLINEKKLKKLLKIYPLKNVRNKISRIASLCTSLK